MDPRRHDGQPGGRRFEGYEGERGPHPTVREHRAVGMPVHPSDLVPGEEALHDDEFMGPDPGPIDHRPWESPIAEQEEDLRRRVPGEHLDEADTAGDAPGL